MEGRGVLEGGRYEAAGSEVGDLVACEGNAKVSLRSIRM